MSSTSSAGLSVGQQAAEMSQELKARSQENGARKLAPENMLDSEPRSRSKGRAVRTRKHVNKRTSQREVRGMGARRNQKQGASQKSALWDTQVKTKHNAEEYNHSQGAMLLKLA